MADQFRDRLIPVLERAVPPHARVGADFYVSARSQPDLARRIDTWLYTAADGDRLAFQQILRLRRVSWDAFVETLKDVRLRDPNHLPQWASALSAFGKACSSLSLAADAHAIDSVVAVGTQWAQEICNQASLRADASARDDLGFLLAHRVFRVIGPTLDALGNDGTRVGGDVPGWWLALFERWPASAWLVGTTLSQWCESISELAGRLHTDRAMLVDRLWSGVDPGPLVHLTGDAGDPHDGGRSVVLLRFASGMRLVYKTKDLRASMALLELVRWLNQAGLPLELPTRQILARDGYGWDEWVTPAPCTGAEDVARFYFRLGSWARLLQLVGARDFWLDNLIAAADQPVFVDLETVMHPHPPRYLVRQIAEQRIDERIEDGVLATGAITLPSVVGRYQPAEDLGAASPWREIRTPLSLPWLAGRQDMPGFRVAHDGRVIWSPDPFVPRVGDGPPADPLHYHDELVAGYLAMQRALRSSRAELSRSEHPLSRLTEYPVRVIWRNTWDYQALIQESTLPERLADGVSWEAPFHRLYRAFLRAGYPLEEVAPIVTAEIRALSRLDVPLFVMRPHESSIADSHGPIGNFVDTSPAVRLSRRVERLVGDEENALLEDLRSTLAVRHYLARRALPQPWQERTLDIPDWRNQALEIGKALLSWAEQGEEGSVAFAGLAYDHLHDCFRLGRLQPELLTGTCGLAIVFAEMVRIGGGTQFQAVAQALAQRIRGQFAEAVAPRRLSYPVGGFVGCGALAYTLVRCAGALGDPSLLAAAREGLLATAAAVSSSLSVIDGSAGLLLASTSLPRGDARITAWRNELLATVEAAFDDGGIDPAIGPSIPLPCVEAALSLTRFRIGMPQRQSVEPLNASSWLLARAACSPEESIDPALITTIDRLLSTPEADWTNAFFNAEVALTAYRKSNDPHWLTIAGAIASRLLAAMWLATVDQPGVPAKRHMLSALWGLPALCHLCLRLAEPERGGSLWLLEC